MKLLDIVALTHVPEHGLRGRAGTILEELADDAFEVAAPPAGLSYAILGVKAEYLMVLKNQRFT